MAATVVVVAMVEEVAMISMAATVEARNFVCRVFWFLFCQCRD